MEEGEGRRRQGVPCVGVTEGGDLSCFLLYNSGERVKIKAIVTDVI